MQFEIINNYKGGIYGIVAINSRELYVGGTRSFEDRRFEHFKNLKYKCHCNNRLQDVYDKYKREGLRFIIIEPVSCQSDILTREQYWMDLLQPSLNICLKAGKRAGVKHRPESIEKLRVAVTGTKQSPSTIEKRMSQIRGIKRPKTREKCRKAYRNRSKESLRKNWDAIKKPILEFDKDGKFVTHHDGLIDAANKYGILMTSICNNLNGRCLTTHNRIFKYES